MSTPEGIQLSHIIRQKVGELIELSEGLDEETARRAPGDRWSPKEIISHVCGPEGIGLMGAVKAILDQETPELDLDPGNPFFTEKRSRMTLAELLTEMRDEYNAIADLVAALPEEQLARKAHIPMLKETPMGEYPTLAVFVRALAEHHLGFHIDHMREIIEALGVTHK
jgi:hypothetical protein